MQVLTLKIYYREAKMKVDIKTTTKSALHIILFIAFGGLVFPSQAQDSKYEPKGNPVKWNFVVTPFLLVPNVSGHVQSKNLSEDFGIGPSEFISSLQGTFMMDAEISKGMFFANAAYVFTDNEVEKILWTSQNGNNSLVANPELKKHIFEFKPGMRFRLGDKFLLDPYAGFRYTKYYLLGTIEGTINYNELNEKVAFWDPIIGLQSHFYPHPRIPIELKADVGGFGVGSELTWSAILNTGYTISPTIDLMIGFAVLENQYENETSLGNKYGLTSTTYGLDFGVRIYIPTRSKDATVFKKFNTE